MYQTRERATWKVSLRVPKCPHCTWLAAALKRIHSVSQATNPACLGRKVISEGDHGHMLQRSREDKNMRPFGFTSIHSHFHPWLPIPCLFFKVQTKFSLLCNTFHDPTFCPLVGRVHPSLLCWALSKSCFSGAEGCRALRVEGMLTLVGFFFLLAQLLGKIDWQA